MNDQAQGAAATGESDETIQQTPTPQQQRLEQAERTGTMLDTVLDGLDVPPEVLEDLRKRRKKETTKPEKAPTLADKRRGQMAEANGQEVPEEEAILGEGEAETEEVVDAEEATEPETEPEEETPEAVQGAADEEHPEDGQIQEDWPEDARAQVLDARKGRKKAREEAKAWKETAEELHARLQAVQQSPPRPVSPTFQEPLPDVMNPGQLEAANQTWRATKRWAEDHAEGAEKGVDKGPEGEELTRHYTPEEVRDIKRRAEDILEIAVPKRAAWIQKAAPAAQEAVKLFPWMRQPESQEARLADMILTNMPEIRRDPEWAIAIGDYVTGYMARMARNGQRKPAGVNGKPLSKAAQTVLNAPKLRPAPSPSKARSVEEPGGSGVGATRTKARETLLESNLTDQDLERYVAEKLAARRATKGRAAALVT